MKNKQMIGLMIAVLAFVVLCSIDLQEETSDGAVGDTFTVDGIPYEVIAEDESTGTYEVKTVRVGANTITGSLTIPGEVEHDSKTYKVVELPVNAFFNNPGITSITLSENLRVIGGMAFGCVSTAHNTVMTSIVIPDSVEEIGDGAFRYYDNLNQVVLGSGLKKIGTGIWEGNTTFTSIEVGSSSSTPEAKKIIFRGTVVGGCNNFTFESVDLTNATALCDSAFSYSTITNLTLGSKIEEIPYRAFYCALPDMTDLEVPSNIKSIGEGAFYGNNKLATITLPDGLEVIGATAFGNNSGTANTSLKSIVIPDSVTEIGDKAFRHATALNQVVLGTGLNKIGTDIWEGNENLTSIEVKSSSSTPEDNTIIFKGTVVGGCNHFTFDNVNLTNATALCDSAFSGSTINSLTLGSQIEEIPYHAFYGALSESMDSIVIPKQVEAIGEGAFYGNKFSSITFESGSELKTIGISAFGNNSGTANTTLTSIVIPDSVTEIGDQAFRHATGLKQIVLGTDLVEIGYNIVQGNTKFNSIEVNSSSGTPKDNTIIFKGTVVGGCNNFIFDNVDLTNATALCDRAFSNSTITSLTLGSQIEEIPYRAFYCALPEMETLEIPSNIKIIGEAAFYGNNKLATITLPDGLEVIGASAFGNNSATANTALTSLTIPKTVTQIGSQAFRYMTAMTQISITGSAEIGKLAFEGCAGLETISLPATVNMDQIILSGPTNFGIEISDCELEVGDSFDLGSFLEQIVSKQSWTYTTESDGLSLNEGSVTLESGEGGIVVAKNAAEIETEGSGIVATLEVKLEVPKTPVDYPEIEAIEVTYDGEEHITEIEEGTGYTVTQAKGTDVGDYKAVFKLDDGYIWSDEKEDDYEVVALKIVEKPVFKVIYDKNGGAGTDYSETEIAAGTHALKSFADTGYTAPSGKQFAGWGSTATSTEYITEVTVSDADVTVYAIYVDIPAVTYSVIYDKNGGAGTDYSETEIAAGEHTLKTFAETGYTAPENKEFDFWGASKDATEAITSVTVVDANVTVYAIYKDKTEPAKTLSSIAITTQPTKTAYTVGQTFDKTGMVVTATYDDASSAPVTTYTFSPEGALALTDTKVTVSYTEGEVTKTAEVAITVTAPEYVAQIGDVKYATIAEAIEAVKNGETIKLLADVTVESEFKNTTVTFDLNAKGRALNLADNITFSAAVQFGTSKMTVENITTVSKVKFVAGSVELSGTMTATEAQAKIAGEKDIIIKDLTITEGNLIIEDDVTIEGKVVTVDDASIQLEEGVTATMKVGADITDASFKGDGEIVAEERTGSSTISVYDDSAKGITNFPADQVVNVVGDWTLVDGAIVYVKGQLDIPAGKTVTISSGAQLIILNEALVNIEGTLIVEEKTSTAEAGVFTVSSGNVIVDGYLEVNGMLDLTGKGLQNGNLTVKTGGKAVIGDTGDVNTDDETVLKVEKDSEFIIYGMFDGAEIYNYGTITIDSESAATEASTIYQMADGATVDVKKYTIDSTSSAAKLTITDDGLIFLTYKDSDKKTHEVTTSLKEVVTLTPKLNTGSSDYTVSIEGVKTYVSVSSSSTDKEDSDSTGIHNGKQYAKTVYVEGAADVSYTYTGDDSASEKTATGTIALDGPKFAVKDTLELGDGVTLSVAEYDGKGELSVTGKIITTSDDNSKIVNEGLIKVTKNGEIRSAKKTVTEANIWATKVVINSTDSSSKTTKIYAYMSIDAAIDFLNGDNAVKQGDVLGTQTLSASKNLNAERIINVGTNILNIGSSTSTGVVLNVDDEAQIKGTGTINVYGTLYAENKTKIKPTEINSDVYSEEVDISGKAVKNGWAKWTNLSTAISEASYGDVIKISDKKTDKVKINSNLTIPEGITLQVPNTCDGLWIADGVTLTVNGTLTTDSAIYVQSGIDLIAQNVKNGTNSRYASAIVVNGSLESASLIAYGNGSTPSESGSVGVDIKTAAPIAGAYYSIDNYYVISGLETAFYRVADITTDITVKGKVTDGILAFYGTDDCEKLIVSNEEIKSYSTGEAVTVPTVLTVSTLSISDASFEGNGEFNGIIVFGNDSIRSAGAEGLKVAVDSDEHTVISGTIVLGEDDGIEILYGDVYVGELTATMDDDSSFEVAVTAELIANASAASIDYLDVYGSLTIPSGKSLTINKGLVDFGIIQVTAATSTTPAGSFAVSGDMYIGMEADDHIGDVDIAAAAVMNGPANITGAVVYVLNGASMDLYFIAELDKMTYSLDFYVEDSVWFTVYSMNNETLNVTKVPVANAELNGWATEIGGAAKYRMSGAGEKASAIPINAETELFAVLDYQLYEIYVIADIGIKNVSIDGKLMSSTQTGRNEFVTPVDITAGNHTITYELIGSYEGTAKMILHNTESTVTVSGLTFNVSGDAGTTYLQLTGIEESDPEPAPTPEEKSEWTVTTILLVILVILIAIMAVIVALRLNRN